MVTGLVSGTATSGALAAAKAEAAKLKGLKGPETTNASTSAQNINSIFEAAKQAVEAAKNSGTSISDTAVNDINNKSEEIVNNCNSNKEKIAQIISESTSVIAEYTAQIVELNEQKQSIEDKIKEKGGEIQEQQQDTPQSQESAPAAPPAQPTVDENGNIVEQPSPNTNTNPNPTPVITQKGGEVDPEIASLQEQLKGINTKIGEVNTQIATKGAETATNTAAVVAENTTMVKSGQGEIQGIKTKADGDLNAEITKLNQKSIDSNTNLTKEITDQTTHQGTNTTNSTTAKTAAEAARTAANAAASDDPNKASLEQVAQELDGLSTDFGMQNGIAKSNMDNKTKADQYKTEIQNAINSAVTGDFAQFSQKLNEAFTTAMQNISQNQNIEQGQEKQPDAKGKDDRGSKLSGGDIASMVKSGFSPISNIVGGSSSGSGSGGGNMAMDIMNGVIGGLEKGLGAAFA